MGEFYNSSKVENIPCLIYTLNSTGATAHSDISVQFCVIPSNLPSEGVLVRVCYNGEPYEKWLVSMDKARKLWEDYVQQKGYAPESMEPKKGTIPNPKNKTVIKNWIDSDPHGNNTSYALTA